VLGRNSGNKEDLELGGSTGNKEESELGRTSGDGKGMKCPFLNPHKKIIIHTGSPTAAGGFWGGLSSIP